MKKLIFRKFIGDTLFFFLIVLLVLGIIVWVIQAINYFDYVAEDGHGLKVYFFYSIFNYPKIINRILPFVYFISLFYILLSYEYKNELNIFWLNGISKLVFCNQLIKLSLFIMIIQILLGSYISPKFQYKARLLLKNSDMSFLSSLIKEGKFVNAVKGLTIFIEKKNDDGSFTNIFLDDSTTENSRIIVAKKGNIIQENSKRIFKLEFGQVLNEENSKINFFNFDQIYFNLEDYASNTIVVPKIQEIDTMTLLSCFFNVKSYEYDAFVCDKSIIIAIKEELLKRLFKPIYIPIISILCMYLIIYTHVNNKFNTNRKILFLINFILIVISETSLRYSLTSKLSLTVYILLPIVIFYISYFIFKKRIRYA
jgi:lipopolysaccharide export system permease protein